MIVAFRSAKAAWDVAFTKDDTKKLFDPYKLEGIDHEGFFLLLGRHPVRHGCGMAAG